MSFYTVLEFNGFQFPCSTESEAQLERTRELLSKLSKEEPQAVDVSVLGSKWEDFRATEPSKSAVVGLKPEHLVSPAGPPGAALCCILHFPTYKSGNVNNGSVFDPTNPSIARVAGSGFDDKNCFWLDLFCRRRNIWFKGDRFQPRKHAEAALLQYHLEWLHVCLSASTSKVLVVFGKQNEEYFRGKWGNRLRELKLSGDYKDNSLWMLYAEGDDDTRVERLVLFAPHPEYIGRQEDIALGRAYDQLLGLAARLAGVAQSNAQIHFQETSCTNPESLQRAVAAASTSEQRLEVLHRRENVYKRGLTKGDVPLQVMCCSCGTLRLDVSPYFFVPDWTKGTEVKSNRIYVRPLALCATCGGYEMFRPADANVKFENYAAAHRGGRLYRILAARGFREGRKVRIPVRVRHHGRKLEEEHAPKMIRGSEVFTRSLVSDTV